jgi:hypothetical protein
MVVFASRFGGRLASGSTWTGRPVLSSTSRSKVERGDFRHFLGLYAPDSRAEARALIASD